MRKIRLLVLLLVVVPVVHSQGIERAEQVRGLNNALLRLHGQLQATSAGNGASLRSQAAQVIQDRFDALQTLIDEDPTKALELAFEESLLERLRQAFPASASQLESHGVWEGPVDYIIFDDPSLADHRVDINMKLAQETLSLHFPDHEPGWLKCGDIVRVEGLRAGSHVASAGGSVTGTVAGAGCSTLGDQKTAVILIQFPGVSLPANATPAMVSDIFFQASGRSVDGYWRESSHNQASASGVVAGPYTLSSIYTCDQYYAMRDAAIAAADPDVNFTQYTRVMIVFPNPGGCGWAGLGMLGCNTLSSTDGNFTASVSWLLATYMTSIDNGVKLSTHEGGHNLTLHHASSRAFTSSTTGLSEALGPLGTAGTLNEYGDVFNTLGSWNFGQYNAPHKKMIGWLTSADYSIVQSNGSFSVNPFENSAGLRALKVQRGTGNNAWLWLEYRQPLGLYDSAINSQVYGGALAHYEDSATGTHTHLLDMTPGSSGGFNDPAKVAGSGAFVDPYTNVSFSVDSASPTAMGVTVTYGAVPCVQSNPTVSISPSNPTAPAGTNVNYTVTVTNNDSSGCSSKTFNVSSTLPDSWATSLASGSLVIGPSQSASTAMTKSVPAGTLPGTYAVTVVATDGTFSGTGNANCTVAAPPSVTLSLAGTTYSPRSTVSITAKVTDGGSPAANASVTFTLTKPGAAPTAGANGGASGGGGKPGGGGGGTTSGTTKTVLTDATGTAIWNYRLGKNDPSGCCYSVSSTATFNGLTGTSNTVTFSVQ